MKNLWYLIGALAALVFIAILVRGRQESPVAGVASLTPEPTVEATVSPTPTPTRKVVVKARASIMPPVPTYAELAEQYTGRRIQFDEFCQVSPIESSFIEESQVLLDNRSPDDRVVTLGGMQHGLRGYGWKVVTMTSSELPVTWAIDCGTAKNVGKIVIEPVATPTPEPLPSPASSSGPLVSPSPESTPSTSEEPFPI